MAVINSLITPAVRLQLETIVEYKNVLKEVSMSLCTPLARIFENSIKTGLLPENWKCANMFVHCLKYLVDKVLLSDSLCLNFNIQHPSDKTK